MPLPRLWNGRICRCRDYCQSLDPIPANTHEGARCSPGYVQHTAITYFVSVETEDPHLYGLLHEIEHTLEDVDPEAHDEFMAIAKKYFNGQSVRATLFPAWIQL